MNELLLNLSMLGEKSTGLGVYAINCKNELEKNFYCKILGSVFSGENVIKSPSNIRINGSKYASIKRILYSSLFYPKNLGFIYTPTHHGIIGYENQVITIHDLICIHYPKQHRNQYLYFKYVLPKIIKKCKAIFTVSYETKKEICNYYHLSNDFIHVIPNALSPKKKIEKIMYKTKKKELIEEQPYLLTVGAGYPHKNIHELIQNHKCWKNDYFLKIVSAKGEYERYLKKIVSENGLKEKVEFLGYVTRQELEKLYQNCSALVYPSLWEGFGIPPLEALSYGKPIILSDIPVFHEIFEKVAIYVKINNVKSWEYAFQKLQNRKKEEQIDIGKEILKKYNWENNGKKMREIFLYLEPRLKGAVKDV